MILRCPDIKVTDAKITNETEFCEFDGVETVTVYAGGLSWLTKVPLKWRVDAELSETLSMRANVLTAGEILEQTKQWLEKETGEELRGMIVTLIVEGPLYGVIYQYGNYSDGEWYKIGELRGYA